MSSSSSSSIKMRQLFPKLLSLYVPILGVLYLSWLLASLYFTPAWLLGHLCVLGALSVVAWTLAYFVYDCMNGDTITANGRAVVITGCDTGFGHELAVRLDNFGFTVFAGVLFPDGEGARKLTDKCSRSLRILKMDVTSPEEVKSVVEAVKASNLDLWAVVNNAGIGVFAPFDWGADVEEFRKMFDINVLGVIRVTKCFMPLLRKSQGRIVNVSSLAGRIGSEGLSHYTMAKHSVRVFSDIIRRELYNTGIQVITLEPTFYRTEIINNQQITANRERLYGQTPEDIRENYAAVSTNDAMANAIKFVNKIARANVGEVTAAMQKAVTLKRPKPFYRCCGYSDLAIWALSHAPEVIVDFLIYESVHNPTLRKVVRGGASSLAKM